MPFQSLSLSFAEDRSGEVSHQIQHADLDAVFRSWECAANKSQFISALDLPTAQAVMERILRDAPTSSARRLARATAD